MVAGGYSTLAYLGMDHTMYGFTITTCNPHLCTKMSETEREGAPDYVQSVQQHSLAVCSVFIAHIPAGSRSARARNRSTCVPTPCLRGHVATCETGAACHVAAAAAKPRPQCHDKVYVPSQVHVSSES